ncbi:hypothetical protein [Leptolyngbya ohadii]|uniref:hypothetical protein n=1 Tax=Leptolyngbya ohadii TaxID=1962290 RepID=UPI000B59E1EA|nr:hypothetical protein [Leptolyngbya ohadii]
MNVLLAAKSTIAQAQQPSQQSQLANPLINQNGQDIIYLGMGLMAIVVILVIGLLSRRMEYAIVFSLILAAVIIVLVTLV